MTLRDTPCPMPDPLVGAEHHNMRTTAVWRSRGIDDWLLWRTLDGAVQVAHEDGSVVHRAGDWCLLAPHTTHDYHAPHGETSWRVLWVVFQMRTDWQELVRWPQIFDGIGARRLPDAQADGQALAALRDAVRLQQAGWPGSGALAVNRLEACLLWLQAGDNDHEQFWDPRIRGAVDDLIAHLAEPFDLARLAARWQLSVPHFCRLFRAATGLSPQRWVQERRLDRARQLLESSRDSVASIAERCGFGEGNYLARRFRQRFHCSPSAYRQRR